MDSAAGGTGRSRCRKGSFVTEQAKGCREIRRQNRMPQQRQTESKDAKRRDPYEAEHAFQPGG